MEGYQHGTFTISSGYDILRKWHSTLQSYEYIWGARIPIKISIFLLKLLIWYLPFADPFMGFGFALPSKCPFCDSMDTLENAFISYQFVFRIWRDFEVLMDVPQEEVNSLLYKFHVW
ncbi:hypothetical protein ACH5RR_036289 [Cinchona calisaya]|uniref:Reverse transcriptase zinc-binding domain-containing protein n=1 Tax=Cinchona calisaya TaxID=153742 RepID=A0ABD2Y6P5_9GENT